MEDYYAHAQQSATALRIHLKAAAAAAATSQLQYGSIDYSNNAPYRDEGSGRGNPSDSEDSRAIIADDLNPVSAYFEIVAIRRLLLEHVGVVISPGQIHTPDVQLNLITPLWQAVRARCGVCDRGAMRHRNSRSTRDRHANDTGPDGGPLTSAAMLYASLANRDYFLILAGAGQSQSELHESRAEVAEALAILCAKALHKLGTRTLSNALCAKFAPLDIDGLINEGGEGAVRGERHMSLLSPDQRVRVYRLGRAGSVATGVESPHSKAADVVAREYLSGGTRVLVERALEVAIRSEAKRFTALKPIAEVVQLLWNGTLHWKGFSCVALPSNAYKAFTNMPYSPDDFDPEDALLSPVPSERNNAWPIWASALEKRLARILEPLRIPVVENTLIMIHAFFFLALYTIVSLRRQDSLSIEEVILHICALAYIADEVRQCTENGLVVYFKSVWNILDVSIYGVFVAFFCLRMRSIYTGSQEDLDKAYDVLALNASMLWPRLFAVLDQFEFCGTIIIQVRRIISGTSLFFALLIVLTAGFFQTFFSLSQRHNELGAKSIWGLMARIFFGSALVGWDQADLFGPYVGYLAMSMYITVSMLILYNILIGVINQCMVEITQNAAQEFRFAYTMRVVEYVSAKQTYPCVPPLNILQILVFWPLRKTTTLSHRAFALFRSIVLLMAYMPHLLLYASYKVISRWWQANHESSKGLRTECHLAEKELAWIKIRKDDIDEFAYSGSAGSTSDDEESPQPARASIAPKHQHNMSSVITMQPESAENSHANRTNRWASLMNTWRQRRQQSSSEQSIGWSPVIQSEKSADVAEYLAHTSQRMAVLEGQISEVDRKLATIARLLQPVTDDV